MRREKGEVQRGKRKGEEGSGK
jgi:hypothetical protein